MSNFIVNTDVPNIRVVIREGDQYNINMIPTSVTTMRTGSFNTYADFAGNVTTASYALLAQTVIGSIESASWSAFAVTASYVSGAASTWDTIANKPEGLVSSSAQATTWTVATASLALTASYVSGAASTWDTITNKPDGLVSSSTQILDYDIFATTSSNTFVGNQTITGSILLTGSISSVDYIDINTTATPAGAVGRLQWDDGNGTAVLGLKGGNVNLQLGQELVALVYNADTVPLVDGNVVYISGSQGNRVSVKRASATREAGSANTLGMVTEPIAVGAEGFITLYGVVNNLNTIGLTAGKTLWLSTASGQYTETRPQAPAHGVVVGYVERVHASVGSIYVKVDNGYELDELHNVNDTTTTSSFGDLIVKSGSIWVNSRQLTGSYGLTGSFNVLGTISGSVTLPLGVVSSSAQASTWTVATSSVATTASFALTASYVSGAASSWDTISNKPSGLVSSSTQINTGSFSGSFTGTLVGTSSWAVSSSRATTSSFAISSSFAPTVLPSGTVSSSLQINTGSFSGSFTGTLVGTSSWATNVISASFAPTILPSGTVSSSAQASTWTVATASVATTASFATTASRAVTSSFAISSSFAPTILPSGVVSSSLQINTGSFSGSFIGTLTGTSSWAQTVTTASYAVTSSLATNNIVTASVVDTTITFTKGNGSQFSVTIAQSGSVSSASYAQVAGTATTASFASTASFAVSASFAPTILPPGVVSSSAQATSWTVATASIATTASFALTASYVSGAASTWDTITGKPSGLVSSSAQINTGSFSGSFIGIATTALTASYISGGMVIIGIPTDTAYGGSSGNVSGIASGDRAEDAFDKIETILGKLAPAKPANLSTRILTTNATTYTAYTASGVTPTLFSTITTNARPTASWTFVAATSGSSTTLSYDADAGVLQAEVDGVVSAASQDTFTTSSDVGTFGNLIVNSDLDPYNGTFGQQGFWKGFIASVAPTASLALGPHSSRLLHSTTGNSSLFTWSRDNPSTPTVTAITGSSTGGTTRYVSGVPTLATGETVIIAVTASNVVSQFYNSTRIIAAIGNNLVAPSVNATLPTTPPASASLVSSSITLTVATNAYATASTYTATAYNSAGTTATSTWTPLTSIRVDTISNEGSRARSGIGWYPNIDTSISGAGARFTASANLTGSRELQMTNNLYHYPSSSNYNLNYPLPGPNYIGLIAETTASFPGEAVRWATFSGSVAAASNVSIAFTGTNAAFVGVQTTGSMRLYVRVSGSAATNGWIDGSTAYPGTGNPLNNGDPALVVGSSTTTTKVVTFGSIVKTGVVFVRVGIPSSSLAGSTRAFSGVTITQV
jgi:hypothetical protein